MIAIPDYPLGAMENWGLITYRETAMLYQPGVSSETNKQRVVTVITHELAHQVMLCLSYLWSISYYPHPSFLKQLNLKNQTDPFAFLKKIHFRNLWKSSLKFLKKMRFFCFVFVTSYFKTYVIFFCISSEFVLNFCLIWKWEWSYFTINMNEHENFLHSVVRWSGDHGMVGRPLAERGICHFCWIPGSRQ